MELEHHVRRSHHTDLAVASYLGALTVTIQEAIVVQTTCEDFEGITKRCYACCCPELRLRVLDDLLYEAHRTAAQDQSTPGPGVAGEVGMYSQATFRRDLAREALELAGCRPQHQKVASPNIHPHSTR
jgi:hypothetical protein